MAVNPRSRETRQRLEKCWALELDWSLFPELKEVCMHGFVNYEYNQWTVVVYTHIQVQNSACMLNKITSVGLSKILVTNNKLHVLHTIQSVC